MGGRGQELRSCMDMYTSTEGVYGRRTRLRIYVVKLYHFVSQLGPCFICSKCIINWLQHDICTNQHG